ncbi:flagellar hook-length control protein FliK [Tritonibacter mobilis]|uniref:flagellar hook-length control protein FliK n=1 Tax=Tritonibacter mobilis TaxID=379347 RepID=UPI001CD9DF04|nr:flagellar hook-length control protein FliK [Tritonibacter mobilis]MCA2006134.1 flagellar hook-length control protein FliK [Tritonibacter mobilis]
MITKILTTQSVGSTPAESSKRTDPARRGGDSFESVLARKANEQDQNSSKGKIEAEAPTGEDAKSQEVNGDQPADGPAPESESAPASEETLPFETSDKDAEADRLVAGNGAAEEGETSSDVDTETDPEFHTSEESDAAEIVAEAGAVAVQAPLAQTSTVTEESAVETPSKTEALPRTTPQAEAEVEDSQSIATRAGLLSETQERNETSVFLNVQHKEVRQQRVTGPMPPETKGQPVVQTQAMTSAEALKTAPPVEVGKEEIRVRDMPLTAVQAQAATTVVSARAQISAGDTRQLHSAANGTAQTLATAQAQLSDTVLKSSSAVVTSLMGTGDAAKVGEDILTQRGAESFALPQLLAEASVRSGASSFRAETPRHVAQQLAEAVATGGKRNVDVTLNPRELGHVNMRVMTTDVGVTVTINAERPETEDLMRRHIQDLAREFKEMGFSDISFQFGSDAQAGQSEDGDGNGGAGGSGLQGEGDAVEETQSGLPLSQQLNIAADRLDIRI